ncbi:glycosyltransferase [Echinococcus multilocularis]|uniref:Mannosyltransferase n=1 Tax=Echinococcus multilocularis TaxID=6211 RepID=A0A068YJA0_ECHMU|nr:glycosyltransferase [Echinococcus multilocularis]
MQISNSTFFYSSLFISGLIVLIYLLSCPYNKVEESFNIQAIHDIYDHMEFSGPVPRTFLGPLFLALPWLFLPPIIPKATLQFIVRAVLGLLLLHAMVTLGSASRERLRLLFCSRFLLITYTQFHLAFYSTRTLPNIFALITVTYALAFLLRGSDCLFIMLSGFGILVFRSELVLFHGPLLIFGLCYNFVKIRPTLILTGLITTSVSLMLTIVFDSYFWQRWLWPEGEVFYFNVIENKSHLWGIVPFYWYFLIALPKALMTTIGLVVCANLVLVFLSLTSELPNREYHVLLGLEVAALVFIMIYSFLPHKELRFIIYAIPIFNLVAAYFWSYVEHRLCICRDNRTVRELSSKEKNVKNLNRRWRETSAFVHWVCRVAVLLFYASLFANLCVSIGLLYLSSYNYPGGEAITRLNNWPGLSERRDVHVYISNLAAQTGVSRFQQVNDHWIYNKTEKIDNDVRALVEGPFTHLILEASKDVLSGRVEAFHQLFTVESFSGITYNPEGSLWKKLKILIKPALVIYERVARP